MARCASVEEALMRHLLQYYGMMMMTMMMMMMPLIVKHAQTPFPQLSDRQHVAYHCSA